MAAWIPKQIVETEDGKTGIIKEYYSSKELNVNEDDIVTSFRELNGWLWVRKVNTGEEGWIPKEVTIDLKQEDSDKVKLQVWNIYPMCHT